MEKKAGILLPIFSLPGKYGIGTLGKSAFAFVDFLKECNQNYWQVLPLNPTIYGDSPYQSPSAFAGNHYFIDVDTLVEEGLLDKTYVKGYQRKSQRVD
ncbi:MAG: 4-alpha-glucanotransferase, partial [Clostridia bacterium]|nr:4-alpha-glucanotransferase [Clostridia bacterium]